MNCIVKCQLTCQDNINGFCFCFPAKQAWAEKFDDDKIMNPTERTVIGNCEFQKEENDG